MLQLGRFPFATEASSSNSGGNGRGSFGQQGKFVSTNSSRQNVLANIGGRPQPAQVGMYTVRTELEARNMNSGGRCTPLAPDLQVGR
jgi:hypothetical protein